MIYYLKMSKKFKIGSLEVKLQYKIVVVGFVKNSTSPGTYKGNAMIYKDIACIYLDFSEISENPAQKKLKFKML